MSPSEPPTDPFEVVSPSEFVLPAAPVRQTASRVRAWLRVMRGAPPEVELADDAHGLTLPAAQLDRLATSIDWTPAGAAAEQALSDPEDRSVRFWVGPPHGGRLEVLTSLAERTGWRWIPPPTPERILEGSRWIDGWPAADEPGWVLPGLERCFLRHPRGLDLIRRLLEAALDGRLGSGIIGCDSWAWAFLRHVWAGPLTPAYTLQSLDGAGLARRFGRASSPEERQRVRSVRNGARLWNPDDADAVSEELRGLAARSRGNLGVAWSLWRRSLFLPAEAAKPLASDASAPAAEEVVVYADATLPQIPGPAGDELAFVLHALLLHDGLPAEWLQTILPVGRSELASLLAHLRRAGVTELVDGRERVSALGYGPARDHLRIRGYLVDDF